MILLFDIGNTHTHVGLGDADRVVSHADVPTADWQETAGARRLDRFVRGHAIDGVAVCSVVPYATPLVKQAVRRRWPFPVLRLTHQNIRLVGIDYPRPETIGPDRLANAVAARYHFGAPVLVVDFGTAVTFDVVDARGNYVGGIIAPGLSAMTDYLHEKTALLPRIQIRDVTSVVGKSTEHAMLVGAVHGYRGLVSELIRELKRELGARRLPVVFTGGYAELMAKSLPQVRSVEPQLTLEGLRLVWLHSQAPRTPPNGVASK